MKTPQSEVLDIVIENSQTNLGFLNLLQNNLLPENQCLKHFALWAVATKISEKEVQFNHRAHSNWNQHDPEQLKVLCRLLLNNMIRKIGVREVETILTDLRLGGINDSQDHVN